MLSLLEDVMFAIAKITAKGQTTIPQNVRAALHVAPGDLVAWEVGADGTAIVRRVQPLDLDYLRALEGTLSEWLSEADEEAYRDL
ncbi:type II toxin-antitoxin system PrlF family antitoxin [Acidithiobacillus sp. MC6.1]|nr:type II toxin-antitoxin system PrlF family antitoxin [Acidithiobacillus sp. MC6.1]